MASTCGGNQSVPAPPMYLNSDKYWTLSKKESSSRRSHSSTPSSLLNSNSSSTQSSSAFVTKCATMVKEQRARFYIMRRCLIMLICWHDYND